MDASKFVAANGDAKFGISDDAAKRLQLASDLRDLADQIEGGHRVVQEFQTYESAKTKEWPTSILYLKTVLHRGS